MQQIICSSYEPLLCISLPPSGLSYLSVYMIYADLGSKIFMKFIIKFHFIIVAYNPDESCQKSGQQTLSLSVFRFRCLPYNRKYHE